MSKMKGLLEVLAVTVVAVGVGFGATWVSSTLRVLRERQVGVKPIQSFTSEIVARAQQGDEHAPMCFTRAAYARSSGHIVMKSDADGRLYAVGPGETLESAMAQHPGSKPGNCYPEGIEIPDGEKEKHDWREACKCYEVHECKEGRAESSSCKRYCRKDKCDCCSI